MSAALGEQGGVAGQVQRPSLVVGDAVADGLPAGAVPVEVAVLQLHPGAVRGLGDERDLDLAGELRVGLDLPLRADVPAEHDPVGWFVGQDPRPAALAAVHGPVVDRPTRRAGRPSSPAPDRDPVVDRTTLITTRARTLVIEARAARERPRQAGT